MKTKNFVYQKRKGFKTHQGKFIPVNKDKYKGDIKNVVYRSGLELKFMKLFDMSSKIIKWSSEEIIIPYVYSIDNKVHRYFPDFLIEVKDNPKLIVIEIKPSIMLEKPKSNIKSKFRVKEYIKNSNKFKYAEKFCKEHNMEFKILTEEFLKQKNNYK